MITPVVTEMLFAVNAVPPAPVTVSIQIIIKE